MIAVGAPTQAPVSVDAEGVVSGAVLRCFRRLLGLNQQQLCERLLIDINTYRAWENGRRPLSRITMARFSALRRGLVELGVPRAVASALEVAVEVDLEIGRALASDDNIFPPDGCTETWRALLVWALEGRVPAMFANWSRVEAPRLCARDRAALVERVAARPAVAR